MMLDSALVWNDTKMIDVFIFFFTNNTVSLEHSCWNSGIQPLRKSVPSGEVKNAVFVCSWDYDRVSAFGSLWVSGT